MSNSSIWPEHYTLSFATTLSMSEPGSNGNKEVLHIFQSSRTGAPLSNRLVSYAGHSLAKSYPATEMQSVFSPVSVDWLVGVWLFTGASIEHW